MHTALYGIMVGTTMAIAGISAHAAVLTSSDFTFHFGSTVKAVANTWTQTESPGNSLPTIGDFTFSPAPSGRAQSGIGPTFPNGVLTDGQPGPEDADIVGSLSNPFGDPWAFTAPVTGSYNGSAPVDAAAIPNYRLKLEITNISIHASRGPNNPTVKWEEQTAGHEATGPSANVTEASSATRHLASAYTFIPWDPADYEIPLGSLNDPFTRTFGFDFPSGTVDTTQIGDGLTFQGRVSLVYDSTGGIPGDFNADTLVNATDIDLLTAHIRAAGDDDLYDVNNDTVVDAADLTYEVETIIGAEFGDTNLDLDVDLSDLGTLATNYEGAGPFGWAQGNFDIDQDVDLVDLGSLATNYQGGSAQAFADASALGVNVPEPASLAVATIGIFGLLRRRHS